MTTSDFAVHTLVHHSYAGEFDDVLNRSSKESLVVSPSNINIVFCSADDSAGPDYNGHASADRSPKLVEIEILTMETPTNKETLIRNLSLTIHQNENLLVCIAPLHA